MNESAESIRQLFEINDTAASPSALAQRIAANLATHKLQGPDHWPEFAITPASPGERPLLPPEAYAALQQAAESYDQIWVQPAPAASRFAFITRLKQAFHRLAIYYVNQLGERQMVFNDRLLRVANHLVTRQDRPHPEVAALRRRVAELEARIEQLEQAQR